jgi:hypothetical protein
MEVYGTFEKVVFGVDGSSIILEKGDLMMRYRISPTQSSSNDHKSDHSSLPMEFVPLHDTQQSVSSDRQSVSSHPHRYRLGNEWILDEQKRRAFWVPPDLRDPRTFHSYGKVVVLGYQSGRVVIANFSNVQY